MGFINGIWAVVNEHEGEATSKLFWTKSDAVTELRKQIQTYYEINKKNGFDFGPKDADGHNIDECVERRVFYGHDGHIIKLAFEAVNGTPEITVKLNGEGYLKASAGCDPAFPSIWTAYSKDGLCWHQDLVGVEEDQDIEEKHTDKQVIKVLVYADEYTEDYTDRFDINVYEEQE